MFSLWNSLTCSLTIQLICILQGFSKSYCAVLCSVASVESDFLRPMNSVHRILQARILEWVAMSSPRESPQLWSPTHISCIADRLFTHWATRKATFSSYYSPPEKISFSEHIAYIICLIYSTFTMLSCFSCSRLCATPQMAAHQALPSLGFSRQDHWSGLPFPSPMYESEKWKWSHSVMSDLMTPWTAAHQAPPSMGFSRQEYWSGLPLPCLNIYHMCLQNIPGVLSCMIFQF